MAAASRKVIISCAVTGSIHTPTMTPYLPITPDEIAAGGSGQFIHHRFTREVIRGRSESAIRAAAQGSVGILKLGARVRKIVRTF